MKSFTSVNSDIKKRLRREKLRRSWYKFSKNKLSVIGLSLVFAVITLAIFADYLTPYPEQAYLYIDFKNAYKPPSLEHFFGTDMYGRDVFTRVIYGFRFSLVLAGVVLSIAVPPGVLLGLIAAYKRNTIIEKVIMRIADIFLGVPPLVFALSITAILTPSVFNAMIAVTAMWWPWYVRIVYNSASSLMNENFVLAAQAIGASSFHIIFREILPNLSGVVLTKLTLDVGWVILIGAALSFVGLGAQPPTPDLGTMIAEYSQYLPQYWWLTIGPAIGIILIILAFNLLGDGINDLFAAEEL